jgi:poly-beta-1,6-N-acetyl-D-glucosamine synthase
MVYVIFVLLSIHLLMLLFLIGGVMKAFARNSPSGTGNQPPLCVIVPFRNEAGNLPQLIAGLKMQTLRTFRAILVNDHSTDNGKLIALDAIANDDRFIMIDSPGEGKKAAITHAIPASIDGDVIVTTDADCTLQENWLSHISREFVTEDVKMVFGPVSIVAGGNIFSRLQSLEFAGVIGVGIAAHALGFPLYCNGANMSYRREVFMEVKGYNDNSEIPSGDDEFLMKKIHERYPKGVVFARNVAAGVSTMPQPGIREFVHQRIRWAGKWRLTPGIASRLAAILVFLIQCSAIAGFAALIVAPSIRVVAYLIGAKVLLEFVFIFTVHRNLDQRLSLFDFLVLQIVYPFYVLYVAVVSNFSTFDWKGRRYSYVPGKGGWK